ncbi:MAG: alpha/beta hydrolase fold domain-containing protein [Nostoc sp.]|uniref:alpha/beta hydrolase fold domain-containing protein n=1 Tax=Nostoc sp. TaxID=1180 RepID=UPI002FFCA8A7
MTSDLQFLPTDPQFQLNPYPWLAKMRQETSAFYDTEQQAWMLFRYDDVERVLSEWKTFSSKPPKPLDREDFTQTLPFTDPPKHQSLRAIVQKVFTPNRVEAMASRITELTHELLAQLQGSLADRNALYAAGHDLADPYLSPLFGDFTRGFPPTFLQAGTRDLFLSNAVRMHRALRKAGVSVELHICEGMPHGGFLGTPEDAELAVEVDRFVAAHWGCKTAS